jgi:hypothetical protein
MSEDPLPFNQECQICQELINYDDEIMRCQNPEHDHIFHEECATTWLLRGSNTCPTCREILTNEPPSINPTLNRHFSEFVPYYDYLEGRSWYINDINLQNLYITSYNPHYKYFKQFFNESYNKTTNVIEYDNFVNSINSAVNKHFEDIFEIYISERIWECNKFRKEFRYWLWWFKKFMGY